MRQIVTADRVRELLHYEPGTGYFSWAAKGRSRKGDSPAGCVRLPRKDVVISIDNKLYLAHRLAWLFVHGEWPSNHIDHIDGNPSNNAIANLRDVSRAINLQNRKQAAKHNRCGVLGVRARGSRYKAEIVVDGKSINLGRFDTKDEAHAAYLEAKRRLHPGCTI